MAARTNVRSAEIAHAAALLVNKKQFYGSAVDNAEELIEADEIQGIDREISLLRVELRREMKGRNIDRELLLKFVDHIVRAVVQRYRMSPQRGEEMAAHVRGLIDGLADSLFGT